MTAPAGERAHFRPDIEGLRAVAIIAVLLFHLRLPGATGGFVGVDVFFVISGFLITGLLLRERSTTGRVDLVSFYSRRFRRLLPAALVVIVVTTLASAAVLSTLRFPDVAGDAAAAALYVSNYRFALGATDYLASEAAPSPLLHFWSLGVEEQFYLFWPLLIVLAIRLLRLRGLGLVLALVAAGSLWLAVTWTDISAPWAFFSLPTRAWQLAVGGLIAVGLLRMPTRAPTWSAAGLTWLGLGLILASVILFDTATPYPGTAAIVPVLGAALVIIGGGRARTAPSRMLSLALPRWIGRISYSLYLWHWPLLILVPIALGNDDPALRLLLVGVAVVFAALSTELIETPIRQGRLLRLSAPQSVALAGACSVAVAFGAVAAGVAMLMPSSTPVVTARDADDSGATVALTPPPTDSDRATVRMAALPRAAAAGPGTGTPSPAEVLVSTPAVLPAAILSGPLPGGLSPSLRQARDDLPRSYSDGCHLGLPETEPPACIYGAADAPITVMLVGDSHAAQWLPTLEGLAERHGWRVLSATKSACPLADVPVWNRLLKRRYRECEIWRTRVLERAAAERPAIIFAASARTYELVGGGDRRPAAGTTDWRDGLVAVLVELAERSDRVVVLADTPRVGYDPLECLASNRDIGSCPVADDTMLDPAYTDIETRAVEAAGVEMVQVAGWLCPDGACALVRGTTPVFRDEHHMTATFAALLASQLEADLEPLPGAS